MAEQDNKAIEFLSESAAETMRIGSVIGHALKGGEVLCLVGQLGAGKTHLIKGIAAGLGAEDAGEVNSPTFVLVNEYIGEHMRLDVYHIDAYRLESVEEFEMLGFDDMCYRRSVVLVEWADKVMDAFSDMDVVLVEISHVSENQRRIIIKNFHSDILLK
jgi:tRNA threonylcarbamoyladenosine biosynthesis protein TsaE